MTKEIDYYGGNDNYIHLKFGDTRKAYNFTPDFIKKYPDYAREYKKYFMREESQLKSPFAVVSYAYDNEIPVNFYYNFTDTPAKSKEEILEYLVRELSYVYTLKERK